MNQLMEEDSVKIKTMGYTGCMETSGKGYLF